MSEHQAALAAAAEQVTGLMAVAEAAEPVAHKEQAAPAVRAADQYLVYQLLTVQQAQAAQLAAAAVAAQLVQVMEPAEAAALDSAQFLTEHLEQLTARLAQEAAAAAEANQVTLQ